MDADGQHDVCNILRIYKELQTEDEKWNIAGYCPWIKIHGRKFWIFGFICQKDCICMVSYNVENRNWKKNYRSDYRSSGIKLENLPFYSKYNNFDDKYPDANMLMQMLLLGFRVREIPAVMHVRTTGVSMHSGLKPVLYMFRMTFSILAVWIREKILKMDEDKIRELGKI